MQRSDKLEDLPEANGITGRAEDSVLDREIDDMEDKFLMDDGTSIPIRFKSDLFKDIYPDECTHEILPRDPVRKATVEELMCANAKVWKGTAANSEREAGSSPIRTRWVLCNKGDAAKPETRALLLACDANTYEDTTCAFAASTP